MKGFYVAVSDAKLVEFIKNHKETIKSIGKHGEELITWVEEKCIYDPIKEEFFDWEPLIGEATGIYGMIADVMTMESTIPYQYYSFGSDEREEAICISDSHLSVFPNALDIMKGYMKELNKNLFIEDILPQYEPSTDGIIAYLRDHEIPAEECCEIFHALMKQPEVLGGKLWTQLQERN